VDLRADGNRNGRIDFDDPSEDRHEDVWTPEAGAVFLANLDDDEGRCPRDGTDEELAACNDASDDVVNGEDDLLDMAPLAVKAMPGLADGAVGTLEVTHFAKPFVRFFRQSAGRFVVFDPAKDKLSTEELRAGVRLAMEGKDIVRDEAKWNGEVSVRLTVHGQGVLVGEDTVRLKVAPVVMSTHLDAPEEVFVGRETKDVDASQRFRRDLGLAATAAGLPKPTEFDTNDDPWMQDIMEHGSMAMPGPGGVHAMRVYFRSANYKTTDRRPMRNGLRKNGRFVFTHLRGKDVAGIVQFDPTHPDSMDTLNSFGNFETVPPFEVGGIRYPLGRVLRGRTPRFYPDASFAKLIDSQGVQKPVDVDTEWLVVAHVDEVVTFLPTSSNPRGWVVGIADPRAAKALLERAREDGHGQAVLFKGLETWANPEDASDISKGPAERTIDAVLADEDIMAATERAAVKIDALRKVLMKELGLGSQDFVSVPFLFQAFDDGITAYQPGMVNGVSLGPAHFAAPKPFGPVIGGRDLFEWDVEKRFATLGTKVHWVDDWTLYHLEDGDVHCGSNVRRALPTKLVLGGGVP
jgi:protein-arginine deiminase